VFEPYKFEIKENCV